MTVPDKTSRRPEDSGKTLPGCRSNHPAPVITYRRPVRHGEQVCFSAIGDVVAGTLFLPDSTGPAPVLIVCHGAGDWKENYFELCAYLAEHGIASLAIDMHGHGESGGERFYVDMNQWVADVRAAVDFLSSHHRVDPRRIAAFGLSSGGTAILEASLVDPRLKALIVLDATVRNSLPLQDTVILKTLLALGKLKQRLTKKGLRLPLAKLSTPTVASEPEINREILANPLSVEAFMSFPLPGGEQAFFVDTLIRVPSIRIPTLVLWGENDRVDPPKTGQMLFEALTCKKELQIIRGNGHVGHLDRNRARVFEATVSWILQNVGEDRAPGDGKIAQRETVKDIQSDTAGKLSRQEKWELLAPFLKQHGDEALAYATLQEGMEYFIHETGFICYTTIQHPVFAPKSKKFAFSDPVCAEADFAAIIKAFLAAHPNAVFVCVSEPCARVLRDLKFKVNCLGYEAELPIQTYNTKGNWKDLDMIKRARNEAKREGITIREVDVETVNREELAGLSKKWMSAKRVSDREIRIYARSAIFEPENDVRKFVAFDREGHVAGFAFYDPMYRDGRIFGYSANVLRCDERRFGRLATALHMEAMEKFKVEGKEVLNLCLAPFVKLEQGKFNDDWGCKVFFKLSARFGNDIYNFQGLSFHKSKYRGNEKYLYFASNSFWPSNDIYLTFVSADVAHNYFSTLGQLVWGMITAIGKKKPVRSKEGEADRLEERR